MPDYTPTYQYLPEQVADLQPALFPVCYTSHIAGADWYTFFADALSPELLDRYGRDRVCHTCGNPYTRAVFQVPVEALENDEEVFLWAFCTDCVERGAHIDCLNQTILYEFDRRWAQGDFVLPFSEHSLAHWNEHVREERTEAVPDTIAEQDEAPMIPCAWCGGEIGADEDEWETERGEIICDRCRWDWAYTCEDCGGIFHESEGGYDDDSDGWYCESCTPANGEGIDGYHQSPSNRHFHALENDVLNYKGFELEVENELGAVYNGDELERIRDIMGVKNLIWGEHDGSLRTGFEIISSPMTDKFFWSLEDKWIEMLANLYADGFRKKASCGYHIHVGLGNFGQTKDEQEATITKIMYIFDRFWTDILLISRRTPPQAEDWARRYFEDDLFKLNQWVKDGGRKAKYEHARYMCINLVPRETVEFRIFAGTLNAEKFLGTWEFVTRTIQACKRIDTRQLQGLRKLRRLYAVTNTMSPRLDAFLTARGL